MPYFCFCSRKTALTLEIRDPDGQPHYAGTCRHLSRAKAQARIRSIGKRFVGRGGSGDEVGHDEQEFTHIAYGSEA